MSRRITIYVGACDPNDEDRLIEGVMRQAQLGDDVTIVITREGKTPTHQPSDPKDPLVTMRVDDELGQRLLEGVNADLERRNDEAARAAEGKPLKSAESQAKETAAAQHELKSTRKRVNEAGWKVVIE